MKKYILKLIDENINKERLYLKTTEKILKDRHSDEFWLRKKQSQENKIKMAINHREKFLFNQ